MTFTSKHDALRLLGPPALTVTGATDHADWNYDHLLGFVAQQRFKMVRSLLPAQRSHRLLEIGYGSGVFMPELSSHTDELHGVDVHPYRAAVQTALAEAGVRALLERAPAERLPYEDAYFDTVVAVSMLEFVSDLEAAIHEVARVLTPAGRLIVVTPNANVVLDAALRIFTGQSAEADFGDRRGPIVPTLKRLMTLERITLFPAFPVPIYRALRLAPRVPSEGCEDMTEAAA